MSVSVHRSGKGAAWRSCKVNVGPFRAMFTVHSEGWAGWSVHTPLGFLYVQRHPGLFIVHGGLSR